VTTLPTRCRHVLATAPRGTNRYQNVTRHTVTRPPLTDYTEYKNQVLAEDRARYRQVFVRFLVARDAVLLFSLRKLDNRAGCPQ